MAERPVFDWVNRKLAREALTDEAVSENRGYKTKLNGACVAIV